MDWGKITTGAGQLLLGGASLYNNRNSRSQYQDYVDQLNAQNVDYYNSLRDWKSAGGSSSGGGGGGGGSNNAGIQKAIDMYAPFVEEAKRITPAASEAYLGSLALLKRLQGDDIVSPILERLQTAKPVGETVVNNPKIKFKI